jgi:hypothetical protein
VNCPGGNSSFCLNSRLAYIATPTELPYSSPEAMHPAAVTNSHTLIDDLIDHVKNPLYTTYNQIHDFIVHLIQLPWLSLIILSLAIIVAFLTWFFVMPYLHYLLPRRHTKTA